MAVYLYREVLINAHHNRMEELRESYKKKILEVEKSPQQVISIDKCLENKNNANYKFLI